MNSYALVITKPQEMGNKLEVWEGIGYQDDDSTWSIKATFTSNTYTIDYPSLNCGGDLIPLSISNGTYLFQEKLNYGKSRCLNNGRITMTIVSQNSAHYSYEHPQAIASGQLISQ